MLARIMGRRICVACETRANRARGAFVQYAYRCLADGLLSPEEESSLRDYQAQLALSDADIADIVPSLLRAKAFWSLAQGQLPEAAPPFMLDANERCHAVVGSRLFEEHTTRVRVGAYAGTSFRISKHIRIYQGGSRGVSVPVTQLQPVGDGTLCITSERILFVGPRTADIGFKKLLGIDPYRDGLEPHYSGKKKRQVFAVQDGEWVANIALVAAQQFSRREPPRKNRRR